MRSINTYHWLLVLCLLCAGCFPVAPAPQLVHVSELVAERQDQEPKEIVFPVFIDRFMDQRAHRNILGQYDIGGRGGFLGTVTIAADGDISSPFESIVKRSLKRKGIATGQGPFILKGIIQRAGVGASPDSRTLNAELALELTVVNSGTGALLWQKSYQGVAVGSEPQETLSIAFQDLEMAIDKDASLLGLKKNFLALGDNATDELNRKELPLDGFNGTVPPPIKPSEPLPAGNHYFGKYHALVIGINNYRSIAPLKTALVDAKAVAEELKKDYGFDVTLLLDPTRNMILDSFDDLRRNLTENDNLLIYYAGHGHLDTDSNRGYWLPVDADAGHRSNWLSNSDLADMLKATRAKHVLVVADSCYSGTLTRSLSLIAVNEDLFRLSQKRARTALTSGGLEPVEDSGGGGHSVFAKAFLGALQSNSGVVDMSQIFSSMRREVILNSQQTPQYGDIRQTGHEGGDFIFARRKFAN